MNYSHCSNCFTDEGLKILAFNIGTEIHIKCLNCGSSNGRKLNRAILVDLAQRFFVHGTYNRTDFGGAPIIEFNEHQKTSVSFNDGLHKDVKIFEEKLGVGFFYYAPATWRVGEIEPLMDLQNASRRKTIIDQILNRYRSIVLSDFSFYRVRTNPNNPKNITEYDTPPANLKNQNGRLDSKEVAVLYGAFDVPVCLHECRVTKEDEIYISTLVPLRELRFLDVTEILSESVTEFESLDLSVTMLFGASKHSYEICQDLAKEILNKGFDGIIYPSYFSGLQSGLDNFETRFCLPLRAFPQFKKMIERQIYPNIAIFGYPIFEGKIEVKCINKLNLKRVEYEFGFGPVI